MRKITIEEVNMFLKDKLSDWWFWQHARLLHDWHATPESYERAGYHAGIDGIYITCVAILLELIRPMWTTLIVIGWIVMISLIFAHAKCLHSHGYFSYSWKTKLKSYEPEV